MAASVGAPNVAEQAAPRRVLGLSAPALRLGLGATVLVLVSGGVFWYLTRPKEPTPSEQLRTALKHLEEGRSREAREIAKRLEKSQYRDPAFAAGVEYVLGIAAFQVAEADQNGPDRQDYVVAASYLKEAGLRALSEEYQPSWAYAYGRSLYQTNSPAAARPLLETAVRQRAEQSAAAGEMLANIYLDPSVRTPELLEKALAFNTLARDEAAESDDQSRLLRQQAEILLAQSRLPEAAEALATVVRNLEEEPFEDILQARILMAERRYAEATRMLEPLVSDERLYRETVRQATYLMGLIADQEALALLRAQGETATDDLVRIRDLRQRAITWFQRTLDRFDRTDEALAANVYLGDLLRQDGSHEKSLACYGAALRTAPAVAVFANPWISLNDVRSRVLAAWESWLSQGRYNDAIALTEVMTPLFPQDQAYELAARAHERWADESEAGLAGQTETVKKVKLAELQLLRRLTGGAYARLAQLRRSAATYPDALWKSAEQFRRGQDFENSLKQLDLFLETSPTNLLATARVRRGEVLLDLDRLDESLQELQEVVAKFPTDPAAFGAEYLIGTARMERKELEQADAAWRKVLGSDQLTPDAKEWQKSLLSLARLQFERGALERREAESGAVAVDPAAVRERWTSASLRWAESIQLYEEYLARYAQDETAPEARFYFARALQQHADWLQYQLELAETETARQRLAANIRSTRERSLLMQQELQRYLQVERQLDHLDLRSLRLLDNTMLEVPQVLFALERYDEAIAAYNEAANSAPQSAQLLTAYVQMARCYSRLGKKVEARSLLEQARVILNQKQIPEASFQAPDTNLSPEEWGEFLDRALQTLL